VTASSRTDGEDEGAGIGLSLAIDGFRHLQSPHDPVPALKPPAHRLDSRLCRSPGEAPSHDLVVAPSSTPGSNPDMSFPYSVIVESSNDSPDPDNVASSGRSESARR